MSLGAMLVVSEAASTGPIKFTQVTIVGDSAYAAGGSVGLQDLLQNLVDETRQVVGAWGVGVNGDAHLEYTPQGAPIATTATASTDLLSTGAVLHGFVSTTAVEFKRIDQGPTGTSRLPAGLAEGTPYYVIAGGLTTTAFKVSATVGGAAIDITDAGLGSGFVVVKADKLLVRVMSTGVESAVSNQSGITYTMMVVSK